MKCSNSHRLQESPACCFNSNYLRHTMWSPRDSRDFLQHGCRAQSLQRALWVQVQSCLVSAVSLLLSAKSVQKVHSPAPAQSFPCLLTFSLQPASGHREGSRGAGEGCTASVQDDTLCGWMVGRQHDCGSPPICARWTVKMLNHPWNLLPAAQPLPTCQGSAGHSCEPMHWHLTKEA